MTNKFLITTKADFWLAKLKRLDVFSFGISVPAYLLITLGVLPVMFFIGFYSRIIHYTAASHFIGHNPRAILCVFLAIIGFVVGYWIMRLIRLPKTNPTNLLGTHWISSRVPAVFLALFLIGIGSKIVRIIGGAYFRFSQQNEIFVSGPFYSLIGLLEWMGIVAVGIACAYYFQLRKNNDLQYWLWQKVSWASIVIQSAFGFFAASRYNAAIPIIIYLIVRHYVFEKDLLKTAIGFGLILFVLMPAVKLYSNWDMALDSYFRPVTELQTGQGPLAFNVKNAKSFVFDSSFGRADQSQILSAIFENSGKISLGSTLNGFLISLGPPRLLWKSKPITSPDGNLLGRELGILNPEDTTTSIAPTNIGDLYMNFGFWGTVLGMFIMGLVLGYIYYYALIGSGYSLSGVVLYGIIFIQATKGMEDWIAPVYAGLVKITCIIFAIHLILSWAPKKSLSEINAPNL